MSTHLPENRFGVRRRRIRLTVWGASLFLLAAVNTTAFAASPVEVANFGSNPGNLKMLKYIPDGLTPSAPVVVVMHGCTQNARAFADGTGWIRLADKFGFALALPEQKQANNPLNCFRWFDSNHNRRDRGEALSIKQMVDTMKSAHDIDPKRIYVTGLSAGGAMTSAMLATYPDVFAGGGINAGLPYGCANNQTEATPCMLSGQPSGLPLGLPEAGSAGIPADLTLPSGLCDVLPLPICRGAAAHSISPSQWGDFVRHASSFTGPFPKVSIWHGSADATVSPVNATEEMQQWTNVHGIDPSSAVHDAVKTYPHQTFKNAAGDVVVETFSITGMSHGQPVDPGAAGDQCGTQGPFVIDKDICASFFIARFWGLAH